MRQLLLRPPCCSPCLVSSAVWLLLPMLLLWWLMLPPSLLWLSVKMNLDGAVRVVLVDLALPVLVSRPAVNTAERVSLPKLLILQSVQHTGHLGEDEDAPGLFLRLG